VHLAAGGGICGSRASRCRLAARPRLCGPSLVRKADAGAPTPQTRLNSKGQIALVGRFAEALIDRLETEQAKPRIVEGNFAAARYHLAVMRERHWKLRLALGALQVAPRLMRTAC
jgi:hypothetical protein